MRLGGALAFEARNTGCGVLNERCGADFVQKERSWPESFCAAEDAGRAIASVDGDADRLVYIWAPAGGNVRLLDGDKIAALAARHLGALINDALGSGAARVGVVQTAYANGASTEYIRNTLGVDVAVAKTGVKHLHPAAERFDVGIYFEANGHGTVLFSDAVVTAAQARLADPTTAAVSASACKRLLAFVQMINQAVGDAMSGILMVEAMLRLEGMSMADWDALYADLPSRQVKVVVANKDDVRTESGDAVRCTRGAAAPRGRSGGCGRGAQLCAAIGHRGHCPRIRRGAHAGAGRRAGKKSRKRSRPRARERIRYAYMSRGGSDYYTMVYTHCPGVRPSAPAVGVERPGKRPSSPASPSSRKSALPSPRRASAISSMSSRVRCAATIDARAAASSAWPPPNLTVLSLRPL